MPVIPASMAGDSSFLVLPSPSKPSSGGVDALGLHEQIKLGGYEPLELPAPLAVQLALFVFEDGAGTDPERGGDLAQPGVETERENRQNPVFGSEGLFEINMANRLVREGQISLLDADPLGT